MIKGSSKNVLPFYPWFEGLQKYNHFIYVQNTCKVLINICSCLKRQKKYNYHFIYALTPCKNELLFYSYFKHLQQYLSLYPCFKHLQNIITILFIFEAPAVCLYLLCSFRSRCLNLVTGITVPLEKIILKYTTHITFQFTTYIMKTTPNHRIYHHCKDVNMSANTPFCVSFLCDLQYRHV